MGDSIVGKLDIRRTGIDEKEVEDAASVIKRKADVGAIEFPALKKVDREVIDEGQMFSLPHDASVVRLRFHSDATYYRETHENYRQNVGSLFEFFKEACRYFDPCYAAVHNSYSLENMSYADWNTFSCKPKKTYWMNYLNKESSQKLDKEAIENTEPYALTEINEGYCWVTHPEIGHTKAKKVIENIF